MLAKLEVLNNFSIYFSFRASVHLTNPPTHIIMHFVKSFIVLAAAAVLASATRMSGVEKRTVCCFNFDN